MDRKKIISFVDSLLAKTIENGCTEAEALAAASKVNELLQKYDISYSEIGVAKAEMSSEKFGLLPLVLTPEALKDIEGFLVAVAEYFDVRVWKSWREDKQVICFFGSQHDTIFAKRTVLMLLGSFDSEFAMFEIDVRKRNGRSKPNKRYWAEKRTGFSLGFASRISERYRLLKAERTKAAKNSKELVVIKKDLVVANLKKAGYSEQMGLQGKKEEIEVEADAFEAGRESADRVEIETKSRRLSETKRINQEAHS